MGGLLTALQSLLSSKRVVSAEADSLEIKIKSHPSAARKGPLCASQRLRRWCPRHNSEDAVSPLTLVPGIQPGCVQAAAELPPLQDKAGAGEAALKIWENISTLVQRKENKRVMEIVAGQFVKVLKICPARFRFLSLSNPV